MLINSLSHNRSITDHEHIFQSLAVLLRKETVPHAMLFVGIKGVGKQKAAVNFAMACNCLNLHYENEIEPCQECRSCKKIQSENHPDVINIKSGDSSITIDMIRSLGYTLAMKPFEAKWRVIIIADAQLMTPSASNALLKVLEEPPKRTIFILTATREDDLLTTILSRCHRFSFNRISKRFIQDMLIKEYDTDPKEAKIIAAMAKGSYKEALFMKESNWIEYKNWVILNVDSLFEKPAAFALALAEVLSKNKKTLINSLDVIQSWFRDLVIYKYNPNKIINTDLVLNIQKATQRYSADKLVSIIDGIVEARKDIEGNANLRLIMERLIYFN